MGRALRPHARRCVRRAERHRAQVVAAVGAALRRDDRRYAAAPTANAEAYRLYLRGGAYFVRPDASGKLQWRSGSLERALALDSALPSRARPSRRCTARCPGSGTTLRRRGSPASAREAEERCQAGAENLLRRTSRSAPRALLSPPGLGMQHFRTGASRLALQGSCPTSSSMIAFFSIAGSAIGAKSAAFSSLYAARPRATRPFFTILVDIPSTRGLHADTVAA